MKREHDYWSVTYALLLALALVGYPLVSGVGSAWGFNSRNLSIAVRACVLLMSLALLPASLFRNHAKTLLQPVLLVFLVVWSALLIRFVWDASVVPIPLDLPWVENTLLILGATFIPALALFRVPAAGSLDLARRILLVVGTMAAILTIVAVGRVLLSSDKLEALGRVGTDTLNPISLGNLGVSIVIAGLLAKHPSSTSRVAIILDSRPSRWLTGLLGLVLVIASSSKGPVLALVTVVLIAQVTYTLRRYGLRRLIVTLLLTGLAGAFLVLVAVLLGDSFGLSIVDRFVNVGADYSTVDRLDLLSGALQQFERAPWTGDAFVELRTRTYPHNALVEMLMTTGLLGFCGLLVVIAFSSISALRLLRSRHSWFALIYVQCLIGAMLSGSVYFDAGFWCTSLAVVGADLLANKADKWDMDEFVENDPLPARQT